MFLIALIFLISGLITIVVSSPSYLIIIYFLMVLLCCRKHNYRFILPLFFSIAWLNIFIWHHHRLILPHALEARSVIAIGRIASIPSIDDGNITFDVALSTIQNQPQPILIKLTARNCVRNFYPGDEWQFNVKLKRLHGVRNPGSFDYEAWGFAEGVYAQGYFDCERAIKLSSHSYHYMLLRFRQSLYQKMQTLLPQDERAKWIPALTLGIKQNISPSAWTVLGNTGTNHLMAIAGLHLGCIAGIGYFLMNLFWRRSKSLCLVLPASDAAAITALLITVIYSALAGFSVPTKRACCMMVIFILAHLTRKSISPFNTLSLTLLLFFICGPLTLLSNSFWLSFCSVFIIFYGMTGRTNAKGLWWKWGRIQWVLTVGLIPLSLILFNQISLTSVVANTITIPLVGFICVPLCLLGLLCQTFSNLLAVKIYALADQILVLVWHILTLLSHLPGAIWYQTQAPLSFYGMGIVGVLLLLAPKGIPGRCLGVLFFLPLITYQPTLPKVGQIKISLLDVGQGLSCVVQTHSHVLVFDAGPALLNHYDSGESIVTPFLHSLSIKNIDLLVISHGDMDHIGGASALLANFSIKAVETSVPQKLPAATWCLKGKKWQWDGVAFEYLYPDKNNLNLNNDSSCVLRVTAGTQSLLLTGDIEKHAEKSLVASVDDLTTTVLVAPHHGSKTSASEKFLQKVQPKIVLYPIGYLNRYHFPNKDVVQKYSQLHSLQYATDKNGMISLELPQNRLSPKFYRQEHAHFWNDN